MEEVGVFSVGLALHVYAPTCFAQGIRKTGSTIQKKGRKLDA
jgi:hypothetical protein